MKRSILVLGILLNISVLLALTATQAQRRTQRTGTAQTPKQYLKDGVYKLKDKISFDAKAYLTVALTAPDEWMIQAMQAKGRLLKLDATFGGDYALQFGQKTADN